MKKTCTLLVLMAVLLGLCPAVPADAANETYPVTLDEVRQYVNQEIEDVFGSHEYYPVRENINGSWLSLSEPAWRSHKALAYGAYFGNTAANRERRYIGYNPLGHEFPNPNYPPDEDATTSLNGWAWVQKPWDYNWAGTDLYMSLPNEEELRTALNQKIINGIKYSYGSYFDETKGSLANGTANTDWWKYVLIVQPPTKYTYGYGRMWHKWDSNKDGIPELWYITMRLAPDVLPPDIEVVSLTSPAPATVSTPQTATAVYKNNSTAKQTFTGTFFVDSNIITTETIILAAGQSVHKSYAWTAPAAAGTVTLKAEAAPVAYEVNTANNIKTLTVEVKAAFTPPMVPDVPDCQDAPSVPYSWPVVYSWIVHHSATCSDVDEKGIPYTYDCSWDEPVYETVKYKERLSAELTVNTKQGIAASTWESRGSWEIIPWARARGLDPNEVTRAGYGIEVKVTTDYWTDYETKVPGPASPHGGSFGGPTSVKASFYDTSGRYVQTVGLVPTSGKAGDNKITWELPQTTYTYQDGTRVTLRKHFVSETIKDGRYLVRVTISGAGHDLCLIRSRHVTIYGDLFDDSYTRVEIS